MGFTFYAVAAIVYNQVGLKEKVETYDSLAADEFIKILESLKVVAVDNEEKLVNVNWNC